MIGNELLKEFNVIINLKDNFLNIDGKHIPIKYNNNVIEFYFEKHGLHGISLPVKQKKVSYIILAPERVYAPIIYTYV